MLHIRQLCLLAAFATVAICATVASAQTIVDEWSAIKAPAAPTLKEVTVDPKTTALLMLDFLKQNCAPNPRCTASLPKAQKLLAAAREKNATVIYTLFPGPKITDTLPEVAPKGDEPVVTSFLDKFLNTDLDKILKDHGIKTVIAIGSAANGAVMYTATDAWFHKYETIVPIDGMSGASPYVEQYVTYNFVSAPVMGGKVILTRSDMVKFQ